MTGGINELIQRFEDSYPVISELGTPIVTGTEETEALVELGGKAVEPLIEALKSESSRIVMYSAFCLGEIGDKRAIPPLRELQTAYSAKPSKDTDDYAVLSAVIGALGQLQDKA